MSGSFSLRRDVRTPDSKRRKSGAWLFIEKREGKREEKNRNHY
jgi:hypothetical protein